MKKMTKWTAALLAAMMVWSGFLSCSNPSNDSEPENENAAQNPSEKTIVTSASIIKMSNGVMYYKLGSDQQNLYYDGTYIYELDEEVLYPVE